MYQVIHRSIIHPLSTQGCWGAELLCEGSRQLGSLSQDKDTINTHSHAHRDAFVFELWEEIRVPVQELWEFVPPQRTGLNLNLRPFCKVTVAAKTPKILYFFLYLITTVIFVSFMVRSGILLVRFLHFTTNNITRYSSWGENFRSEDWITRRTANSLSN